MAAGWDSGASAKELKFTSRRSAVLAPPGGGMVTSTQPLASNIGLDILKAGGNAMDAAVAMAAALNVTEPNSTGIGGDAFCLYFDAASGTVQGLNGSGRSPAALTLEKARADCLDGAAPAGGSLTGPGDGMPPRHIHSVTVPGAAAAWVEALNSWGSLPLATVLAPAIALAEGGFPVGTIAANSWAAQGPLLRTANGVALEEGATDGGEWSGVSPITPHAACAFLRPDGSAPRAGDVMRNPDLAGTLRALAEGGVDGFYAGPVADALVAAVAERGGAMTAEDLAAHRSDHVTPLHVQYRGVDVWEIPPNGQGIVALMALNALQHVDVAGLGHNTPPYINAVTQALRLAFADARMHVCDGASAVVTPEQLLAPEYGKAAAARITPHAAAAVPEGGFPLASSDTVSFQTVDGQGNAVAFINSNYMGFGSGIVPQGCGFTLQNRGAGFSLSPGHPNALAGGKRPYHTIIPGMATRGGVLEATFSVMGGFMQPQGHVQVLVNLLDFGLDAQEALDAPRFCLPAGTADCTLAVEDGIPLEPVEALQSGATTVGSWARSLFGRGQIIRRLPNGVLQGGSDGRGDGAAMGAPLQA